MVKKEVGSKRAFYLSAEMNARLDKACKELKLSRLAEIALDKELRLKGL